MIKYEIRYGDYIYRLGKQPFDVSEKELIDMLNNGSTYEFNIGEEYSEIYDDYDEAIDEWDSTYSFYGDKYVTKDNIGYYRLEGVYSYLVECEYEDYG